MSCNDSQMDARHGIYDMLLDAAGVEGTLEQIVLGLNWTQASINLQGCLLQGLCFSPVDSPRILPWPGTLAGRSALELVAWLRRWDSCEAAVGASVVNALINGRASALLQAQVPTTEAHIPPHLAVFAHFSQHLVDSRVAVIGRYPGMDVFKTQFNYWCIERRPGVGDFPDSATATLLPQADWVFITASSIANKTLPQLLSYCQGAKVVLMGPSTPWLSSWKDFGVDYLAGVQVVNEQKLRQIIAEGGGTRIFGEGLEYRVLAL